MRPISALLRSGNTALFRETSRRWQAIGSTVFDLTGWRFEPQIFPSRDEHVTARFQLDQPANFILFVGWKAQNQIKYYILLAVSRRSM